MREANHRIESGKNCWIADKIQHPIQHVPRWHGTHPNRHLDTIHNHLRSEKQQEGRGSGEPIRRQLRHRLATRHLSGWSDTGVGEGMGVGGATLFSSFMRRGKETDGSYRIPRHRSHLRRYRPRWMVRQIRHHYESWQWNWNVRTIDLFIQIAPTNSPLNRLCRGLDSLAAPGIRGDEERKKRTIHIQLLQNIQSKR